jgi:alginate O-acetyltransferase complex protein AlgI
MLFNQVEFFIFFLVVCLLLLVTPTVKFRKLILLVASYYFYAYWDIRFLSLIVVSSLADYWIGNQLFKTESKRSRKILLAISLALNLGLLAFFKYFNFFIASLSSIALLPENVFLINIILPVGISFYTFQTLSYTLDIYRKKLAPCTSALDFFLFVSFFPQLVAGPIVRASEFLPQLKSYAGVNLHNLQSGLMQFCRGMFKKVFIADRLAISQVDSVFMNPGLYDPATVWVAVLGYSVQIYCDFSGYTDMAIGSARILGFELPVNFKHPYLAKNISEFWRRWHISLSFWLRDYLYISLGGNRKGVVRTEFNLMFTMLLGGLWHGAEWTFVLWGGLHGFYLIMHRLIKRTLAKTDKRVLWGATSWLLTQFVVLIAWIFFRSTDYGFQQALDILEKFFFIDCGGITWIHPVVAVNILLVGLSHLLEYKKMQGWKGTDTPSFYNFFLMFSMLFLILIYYPRGFQPFIYFQF